MRVCTGRDDVRATPGVPHDERRRARGCGTVIEMATKLTLITGLEYVVVRDVRTCTHALLVESAPHALLRDQTRHKLRGFGVDAALPVFDIDIPSPDFELVGAASHNAVFLGEDGAIPMMSGAIMRFPDFGEVQLIAWHGGQIKVDRYESGQFDYSIVWSDLRRRVLESWPANMAIPVPRWIPSDVVRGMGLSAVGWR